MAVRQAANRCWVWPLHFLLKARGPGRIETKKIGCGDFFQIEADHRVFYNLSALGGAVLQSSEADFHFADWNLEAASQSFVGKG